MGKIVAVLPDFVTAPVIKRLMASGVRALVVAAATYLATKGYLPESDVTEFVAIVTSLAVSLISSGIEEALKQRKSAESAD